MLISVHGERIRTNQTWKEGFWLWIVPKNTRRDLNSEKTHTATCKRTLMVMEPDSCLHFTDEETGSERHTDFKEFVLK